MPLDGESRLRIGAAFGRDFGQVRVHTDGQAAESARALKAKAYTLGPDIVFSAGRYSPATPAGQRLLAHELAHVVQGPHDIILRQPEEGAESEPETPWFRAPYRLRLENPFSDVEAHASAYEMVPALLRLMVERLAREYPDLSEGALWRLTEWSATGMALMAHMTYTHEAGGHGGAARRFGWNPDVSLTAPWSGSTSYGIPADVTVTPAQRSIVTTAGVNQEMINASRIVTTWSLRGEISYQEAMAYLYAQTNLAAYAVRTFALSIGPGGSDDIANYVASRPGMSVGQLMLLAATLDLISGPAWAALIGQYRYLRYGDRSVTMPTFNVGSLRVTVPNWQMLLTTGGPVVGGRFALNAGGRVPVQVSLDTRIGAPGMAIGAQAHIPATPRLRLSPFARGTATSTGGYLLGVEVQYDLLDWVGLSGTIGIRQNDLLAEPEGAGEGVFGSAALTLDF
jgi:hypothetical protein